VTRVINMFCCDFYYSSAVHQWTEPLRDSSTDNDITLETSSVEPTTSMRYTPWDSSACDAMDSAPTSCLSVRMSILHELCSADHQNTAQVRPFHFNLLFTCGVGVAFRLFVNRAKKIAAAAKAIKSLRPEPFLRCSLRNN
jgi:hypothetical protein